MLKLTDEQLDWLAERIPDHELSPKGGRPPADSVTTKGYQIAMVNRLSQAIGAFRGRQDAQLSRLTFACAQSCHRTPRPHR